MNRYIYIYFFWQKNGIYVQISIVNKTNIFMCDEFFNYFTKWGVLFIYIRLYISVFFYVSLLLLLLSLLLLCCFFFWWNPSLFFFSKIKLKSLQAKSMWQSNRNLFGLLLLLIPHKLLQLKDPLQHPWINEERKKKWKWRFTWKKINHTHLFNQFSSFFFTVITLLHLNLLLWLIPVCQSSVCFKPLLLATLPCLAFLTFPNPILLKKKKNPFFF